MLWFLVSGAAEEQDRRPASWRSAVDLRHGIEAPLGELKPKGKFSFCKIPR